MRVARNLSETNHILFIRKPNNEDAVAQHIWANVVSSLTRTLPTKNSERSQLDDLLANVFSKVLIPNSSRTSVRTKMRTRNDGSLAFKPLQPVQHAGGRRKAAGQSRPHSEANAQTVFQFTHPDRNQTIARVLITYCFVAREDRKRVLLTWLAGQDVDELEAKDLGLPPSWVTLNETSSDTSTQQQREEQAHLRAIRTVGILSTCSNFSSLPSINWKVCGISHD